MGRTVLWHLLVLPTSSPRFVPSLMCSFAETRFLKAPASSLLRSRRPISLSGSSFRCLTSSVSVPLPVTSATSVNNIGSKPVSHKSIFHGSLCAFGDVHANQCFRGKIVSGIQPTGSIHLGNYLGAIKNWVSLQFVDLFFFSDSSK
ncbi:hypothetical protein L6164_015925 [Bauhinia variegata]|uniref:Uncharacterized protein n=1 Tax=Bauhinia variegata TaxID=167791 RepID=A0ACB9NP73_BAUVA|nr:hypothetical protein L6164_015925 [Bauhinia variegata]